MPTDKKKRKKPTKAQIKQVAQIATTGNIGGKKASLADLAMNKGKGKTTNQARKIVEKAKKYRAKKNKATYRNTF